MDTKRRNLIKLAAGTLVFGSAILCSACSAKTAKIHHGNCTKCRVCESVCPHDAISFKSGKIRIDRSKCTGCGECISACPYGALSL